MLKRKANWDFGGDLRCATVMTAIGCLGLAYHDGRVVACTALAEGEAEGYAGTVAEQFGVQPTCDAALPSELDRAIYETLAGRSRFSAVDISWLTPFQQKVLEKTAEIPRGQVRTYGWVAQEIGQPGAVRAVGTALGHNPIPFLIPCHRVVRAGGDLGQYSSGGPAVKARLLRAEGALL